MANVMAVRAAVAHKKERNEAERRRLAEEQKKQDLKALEVVKTYAGEGATGLSHSQLKECLADIAKDFARNTESADFVVPTDDETTFVLRMTIQNHEGDEAEDRNEVKISEVTEAVTIWGTFLMLRPQISLTFDKFDADKSGKLNPEQLKEYMNSMLDTGDPDVTDEDVKWLLGKGDLVGDGQIGRIEWLFCSTVWNREVVKRRAEQKANKKSSMCSIL